MVEEAREGDLLLLAGREVLRPVADVVERRPDHLGSTQRVPRRVPLQSTPVPNRAPLLQSTHSTPQSTLKYPDGVGEAPWPDGPLSDEKQRTTGIYVSTYDSNASLYIHLNLYIDIYVKTDIYRRSWAAVPSLRS